MNIYTISSYTKDERKRKKSVLSKKVGYDCHFFRSCCVTCLSLKLDDFHVRIHALFVQFHQL